MIRRIKLSTIFLASILCVHAQDIAFKLVDSLTFGIYASKAKHLFQKKKINHSNYTFAQKVQSNYV
jgi:hypothetical protein